MDDSSKERKEEEAKSEESSFDLVQVPLKKMCGAETVIKTSLLKITILISKMSLSF